MAARRLSPTVRKACKKASVNNNIPQVVCEEVIYQYYNMIADNLKKIQRGNLETYLNFNLPGIGKLYCKPDRILKIEQLTKEKNESNTSS